MRNPAHDQKVAVPTREGINQAQIHNVLSVMQALGPFVLNATFRDFEGETQKTQMSGESQIAANATFIHCCTCLDQILQDSSRWSLAAHDALYKSMEEVNEAQKKFLEAQRIASEVVQRPSFQLRPKIVMTMHTFFAYWGDPMTAGAAIVGQGNTPEEALQSFDDAFKKTSDQQIVSIAESMGIKIEFPQPPEEPPVIDPEPPAKPARKRKK